MPMATPELQRQYQRDWIARRKAEWFASNGPCVRCESWDSLQLDHRDPSQKVSHRIWSWREVRRSEELAKCRVLCERCHIARTREFRVSKTIAIHGHGSVNVYNTGCRCLGCKEANNARSRNRRTATRA